MGNILVLRIAILSCVFLGGLFAIIAAAGKEWHKIEIQISSTRKRTITIGLWDICTKITGSPSQCIAIKILKTSLKAKHDTTRAFVIISILLYGVVFMSLALAQFLKKEIFQKIIAPVFWSIMCCGIIAMGCYTSFIMELYEGCKIRCPTYGWAYGLGWASAGVSLVGATTSSVSFFMSFKASAGPTASFK